MRCLAAILARFMPSRRVSWLLLLACLSVVPKPFLGKDRGSGLRAKLQRAVARSMAGRSGTAVVLDVDSGEILAQYRMDFAARRLIPPGSALKPFTLLALLESGKLDAEAAIVCKRKLRIKDKRMDCTHPPIPGPLNAATALAYSCNYYFAQAVASLADKDLTQAFIRDGLSSPTGLAEGEAAGYVRQPNNTEERQLQALGESSIEITPLELLAAYRKLALRRKQPEASSPPLATVFSGLEGSVAYGMGQLAQVRELGVAGKTGTAASRESSWTHAWFAGYAPAKNPEIVLVVCLEVGRGGADAAPIAGELFRAYQAARGTP